MIGELALLAAATARLSVGGVDLAPSDFLDGRAIASATGLPEAMLTLTPAAAAKIKTLAPDAHAKLDGLPVVAHVSRNIVELEQPDFDAAAAVALALTGKPPLPDSTDE